MTVSNILYATNVQASHCPGVQNTDGSYKVTVNNQDSYSIEYCHYIAKIATESCKSIGRYQSYSLDAFKKVKRKITLNGVLNGASGTVVALVVGVGLGWTIVGIPAAIYIGMKTEREFERKMARKNIYNQFMQSTEQDGCVFPDWTTDSPDMIGSLLDEAQSSIEN